MGTDLFEIVLELPMVGMVTTDMLVWTSTWRSVLEVEAAGRFEEEWAAAKKEEDKAEWKDFGVAVGSVVVGFAAGLLGGDSFTPQ